MFWHAKKEEEISSASNGVGEGGAGGGQLPPPPPPPPTLGHDCTPKLDFFMQYVSHSSYLVRIEAIARLMKQLVLLSNFCLR